MVCYRAGDENKGMDMEGRRKKGRSAAILSASLAGVSLRTFRDPGSVDCVCSSFSELFFPLSLFNPHSFSNKNEQYFCYSLWYSKMSYSFQGKIS